MIILYQVLLLSRDRGKPIWDPTGLICFFYKKMDSVLKMSLSIEYHTKSDPPLEIGFHSQVQIKLPSYLIWFIHCEWENWANSYLTTMTNLNSKFNENCAVLKVKKSRKYFFLVSTLPKPTIEDFLELINPNWHDKISL